MKSLTTLFLSQAYKDTWDDYKRSLNRKNFACWDYIVLTASNEQQAEGYRKQIQKRIELGQLPSRTHFVVIPDEGGKRVGSGGATLGVIRYIAEHTSRNDFSGLRILVIHSGGDSKRVPQYSALGKLFSPVPHELPDGRASTLFDEFIISMSSVAARIREGMLLLSGDVLLLFNPLQIDYSGVGAAAISFKEDVNTGKNHGVYLCGEDGNVKQFLHKQTEEMLRSCGAVNERHCVDIDTGAVIFSANMLESLYGLISTNGELDEEKYHNYVNETVRLSLYGDFLYPIAEDSSLEAYYNEKPEGNYCEELTTARTEVWNALRPYRMKMLRLAPARFIHFGTTREILRLMSDGISSYSDLDWSNCVNSSIDGGCAGYNSICSERAKIGVNCYLESSYVHHGATIGDNVLLSYIDIHDENVPSDVVLHGLKQKNGRFVVRIYGIYDNPKEKLEDDASFMGSKLRSFMEKNGITDAELWDSDEHSIWQAKLYPECDTIIESVAAALNLYAMVNGDGDVAKWRSYVRKSLCSGFNDADHQALIAWDERMQELVRMNRLAQCISIGKPASETKDVLQTRHLSIIQKNWLEQHLATTDFSTAMRLQYYVGNALGGSEGDKYTADCFKTIQAGILDGVMNDLQYNESCQIAVDKHIVRLPLRVNWGGGWSDTPPYCNENGGTVLNTAILLNGKMPVEVALERIPEKKVVFESRDMDVYGEFVSIEQLQETGDPYDAFALQKACLLACGVIPPNGGNLEEILGKIGGGFVMRSEVNGVPKGSGLGTSSILAAACVKAMFEFMGIAYTEDDLYAQVLCMEQIMSTGGGWQDQIGGITPGIKYITSAPGLNQKMKVQHVELSEETKKELSDRFALIYTGQRRLARNLLRDVVGKYVGNEPDSIYALNEIQRVAALMRFELERGRVDEFAKLLNYHWELSKKIDAGSSNMLIDQIFDSIEEYIDGKMICGAGGGGFLQVILKKNASREDLHQRLKEVFEDNDVDVWECDLI